MTALDYECSHFDVVANFACKALSGEPCIFPNVFGVGVESDQFHAERIEAANSINNGTGTTPTVADFDRALEAAIGETL